MKTRLIIIGAGMATARLLQELDSFPHEFDITVIGEESKSCYNRILLSSILSGDKTLADIDLPTGHHPVTFIRGERVVTIDETAREITTDAGRKLSWDRLVISTGSRSAMPDIDGKDNDFVLGFRDLRDLELIESQAKAAEKAVVIGGGLLGLEAANGLTGLGLDVTVVNRQNRIMPRQLDEKAAGILQQLLENKGINFRLGCTPTVIVDHNGSGRHVALSDSSTLPADMVIVAAGITPNTEVTAGTSIQTDRGIVVDNCLATSVPDIFALGECCQINRQLFGLVAPVYQQAEILAWNLCHEEQKFYYYQKSPTHLKISGINVVTAGDFTSIDSDNSNCFSQTLADNHNGIYRRLICQDNTLTGFQLIGDQRLSAWYFELLDSNQDISTIRHSMMFNRQQADEPMLALS